MKLYRAGDKSKALCETCQAVVDTTFCYRDVPFDTPPGVVKGILVASCNTCGSVVAIPAQSTPAIKGALGEARATASRPIEVNLPAPFVETLDLAAYRIDQDATTQFRKSLLAYYIHRCAESSALQDQVRTAVQGLIAHPLSHGNTPRKRLSFKVTPRLEGELLHLSEVTKLKKTDIIKGLILRIEADILQPETPQGLRALRDLAAVAVG